MPVILEFKCISKEENFPLEYSEFEPTQIETLDD